MRINPAVKILVAHGDHEVCETILDFCRADIEGILCCHSADDARRLLGTYQFSVLLLDVALPGAFPFELIEETQQRGNPERVVLIPSVYNRTAYKRKPASLYGADAYLELHHLSDRLVPLLQELVPEISMKSACYCGLNDVGDERSLSEDICLNEQAQELARMIVADIALYHQDEIDRGIREGTLASRLANQLTEGRRLLQCRIPDVDLKRHDYVLSALNTFASARGREMHCQEKGRHGGLD